MTPGASSVVTVVFCDPIYSERDVVLIEFGVHCMGGRVCACMCGWVGGWEGEVRSRSGGWGQGSWLVGQLSRGWLGWWVTPVQLTDTSGSVSV